MAFREVHRMEIREVIRRWRQGENARSIAEASGLARNTVHLRYLTRTTAPANPGGEHRRAGNGVALLRWLAQAAHPR